ncbi:MAG TPA: helix-turn-helix domain-containing protein [Terriglobales bacterium]
MAGLTPFPEGSIAQIKAALKGARTIWQYQKALCVWLRAALGLNSKQVAKALGWTPASVRRVQALYLRQGDAAIKGPGRGGRRREILSIKQERELLRQLRDESWPISLMETRVVREAYEKAAGRRVPPSTLYRMLARHGWCKIPVVMIPRLAPPKSFDQPAPASEGAPEPRPASPGKDDGN